jgi:hypothetical protein
MQLTMARPGSKIKLKRGLLNYAMLRRKFGTKTLLGAIARNCSTLRKTLDRILLKYRVLIAQFAVKRVRVNNPEPNTKKFDPFRMKKLKTRRSLMKSLKNTASRLN